MRRERDEKRRGESRGVGESRCVMKELFVWIHKNTTQDETLVHEAMPNLLPLLPPERARSETMRSEGLPLTSTNHLPLKSKACEVRGARVKLLPTTCTW